MSNKIQQAMLLLTAFMAMAGSAYADITLPTVSTADAVEVGTWVIGLMGAFFVVKMGPSLAAWGFKKLMGFIGR
ncbi:hypothetical protein [Chitinolyticbacter meiyuanensis]|uniref:hypothetical protein n=1 Tax=Chitinolyticbacter meiyuanensis TaxID=682798 RepID=UPI0011E6071A|nr:hypothetical protein [Chitinolyticbacter meiyuanensis]